MKNVTVSLDDETYRKARRRAAEDERSLSSVVREALQTYSAEESEFDRLARLQNEILAEMDAQGIGLRGPHLSRSELYGSDRMKAERRAAWE